MFKQNQSIVRALIGLSNGHKLGDLALSAENLYPSVFPRLILRFILLLAAMIFPLTPMAVSLAGDMLTDKNIYEAPPVLRVIYTSDKQHETSLNSEIKFINEFADEHGFDIEWIEKANDWTLINSLLGKEGDIIIGESTTVTGGIQAPLLYVLPLSIIDHQQVVARAGTTRINKIEDLFSRQVALKKSSPFWLAMNEYAANNGTMDIMEIPGLIDNDEIMHRVATGQYDVTMADSIFLDKYLPEHPELNAFNISDGRARTWILREEDENLHTALNQFLNKNHYAMKESGIFFDDLPEIQRRKSLRVITYPNTANYFMKNGRLNGFEYALINEFAKSRKLEVDVIIAESHDEMQLLLNSGKGDVIAASLPESSISDAKIKLTLAYNFVSPVVVGRETDKLLIDIRELEGRRITLANESPYKNLINNINQKGIEFDAMISPYGIDIENTLLMVSLGMYDLTVLGSHQLNKDYLEKFDIKPLLTLKEPAALRWAVRNDNTLLLGALNSFIESVYQGKTYNTLYSKYFGDRDLLNNGSIQLSGISPYDEPVKSLADQYSFDWRLIIAQMFQESRFEPDAVSEVGAKGLMQIMPETAEFLKMDTDKDPLTNIHAGIKYLSILRDWFEQDLVLEEKTWFTLASYNAGFNRVKRARHLAEDMGLDKNRWFGNVEKAMLILAKPYLKDGEVRRSCRCGQTVVYVREIRSLYNNYIQITQNIQLANRDTRTKQKIKFDI